MDRHEFDIYHELISSSFRKNDFPTCFTEWDKAQSLLIDKFTRIPSKVKQIDSSLLIDLKAFKRIADSILWHFVRDEAADIRRFFNDSEITIQNLKNHNIESHIRYAEDMKKEYGDLFIISDLLSSSKIGDVLWLGDGGKIIPIEIKDGEVNKRILSAIKEQSLGRNEEYEVLLSDSRYQKQVARIERQSLRYSHESNLYFDEISLSDNGVHKIVSNPSLEIQTYEKELVELMDIIDASGEGYIEVDDSLFLIGIKVSGGDVEFITRTIKVLNPKSHKMVTNVFSKDINESPMAKPVLAFCMNPNMKFKLLNSEYFILQVFLPEVFCMKYSDHSIRFEYHQVGNNFFIKTLGLDASMTSGLGHGTYHRLFNYLQKPETIYKTSKLAFDGFKLNSLEGFENIAKALHTTRK